MDRESDIYLVKWEVREKMKGYEWMDWVQLGGILAVISAIVTTWLLMARDNKSLERDHSDLSSEHKNLRQGQKNLKNFTLRQSEKRDNQFHIIDKNLSKIEQGTDNVWTFLTTEKQKETQKLSLLSYKQQDIQESLAHLSGLFSELEEVNVLNAQLAAEREELLEKNEELQRKNQQLTHKNQELMKQLMHKKDKDRSNGRER